MEGGGDVEADGLSDLVSLWWVTALALLLLLCSFIFPLPLLSAPPSRASLMTRLPELQRVSVFALKPQSHILV